MHQTVSLVVITGVLAEMLGLFVSHIARLGAGSPPLVHACQASIDCVSNRAQSNLELTWKRGYMIIDHIAANSH